SIQNTETQKYEVVRTEKDFEIRHYPTVTMATIASTAKSYKELGMNEPKFGAFKNLINPNETTNFALLSKEGEILYLENEIVGLIEMRKSIIAALKKKPTSIIYPIASSSN
ncbi:MAG: hypothetical protein ACKVOU_09580, partial [Cytophagales bacterium]